MQRQPPHSRHHSGGSGRGGRQQPTSQFAPSNFRQNGGTGHGAPPPTPQFPMSNFHQNPNFTPFQNPNIFNPFLQNPNAVNFPIQNPNMFNFQFPFLQQQLPQSQSSRPNNEAVERANQAVLKARRDLLAAGESLSTWKVSQAALMALQANSWESLGLRMQEVPSLQSLIIIEGKVNAFIHCFVAVRTICSLYEMELELCKNEAVEQFEELELGPLVRHPLVVHYFSLSSDVTEACKITSEEIIYLLHEFKESSRGREVNVDEFLDYVAKKQSVTCKGKLNVRIQNLGMYIAHLKQARKSENKVLQKYLEKSKKEFGGKRKTRPLLSSLKKQMDNRFSALTDRIKSFSPINASSAGKHIRFVSSSSEEEEDDDEDDNSGDDDYEDKEDVNEERNQFKATSQSPKCSDRVSSCPYPSAIEEMTRLGFKSEINGSPCINSVSVRDNGSDPSQRKRKRKRKTGDIVRAITSPHRLVHQENDEKDLSAGSDCLKKRAQYDDGSGESMLRKGFPKKGKKQKIMSSNLVAKDLSFADDSMRLFITTWKEACRENDIDEVFDRMLQFYKFRKKNKVKEFFSSYPFVGLLNVAVTSIKRGMWDSIYDSLLTFSQQGTTLSENREACISIEVEQGGLPLPVSKEKSVSHKCGVTIGDIIEKISAFLGADDDTINSTSSPKEKRVNFLKRLCKCEFWLIKQFSVEEFESLGFGEFLMFLERHMHLLPCELHKCLMGDTEEKLSAEACMQQLQLNVLISQASHSLWENESVSKLKISELLRKQFPLVCLKMIGNDSAVDYQHMMSEGRTTSNCVLFSATLLKMSYAGGLAAQNENSASEIIGMSQGIHDTFKAKEAIEVLLRAPMLADLELWSHWNLIFSPSLGPLVEWLLKEVNTKELLCIVTRGGKVIRIDHSASMHSFLEVLLRGSSFETALQLLSLFAVYGGEQNVPKSLLKCHIQRAFEVFIKNCMETEMSDGHNGLVQEKPMCKQHIFNEGAFPNPATELYRNWSTVNRVVPVVARFILDCLSYLPLEFCSFAADVFLGASQSFIRDAPSAILVECKQIEQRLMLHEVGMSLGVVEWINDYKDLCSLENSNSLISSLSSCLTTSSFELNPGSKFICGASDKQTSERKTIVSSETDTKAKNCKTSGVVGVPEVSKHAFADNHGWHPYPLDKCSDPGRVIETIRQEEFGLDPSLSDTESKMLKKQHARLGRALHCLSQELYSQDSHFLLELVQNADDNIYPEAVEPAITFILQEKGIIILNNEQGFSAENIKALCDVGNSTKKGHNAGYIGKKGIGFKSVFRITDAPEIHSNGFHIKFDITEGQIGFVLPTVIPPCDVDFYSRLVSTDVNQVHLRCWNTCIVLPFSPNQSGGFAMNNIISMFSDLHPSLLLFLHRLKCITFRNMLSDTYVVMKKETAGDGLVKVFLGDKRMNWLVVSEKLQANVIRPDVQTTEISIAFTLEEIEGGYIPQLDQQPVFAFLPLRTYGLKFIIQGDFVLPSSREEVDGDSPWNQWLLSEFPRLFVSSETSFCNLPCFKECPGKAVAAFMSFVPLIGEVHGFFSSLPRMIISKLRMSNCLLLDGDKNEWVPPCKVIRNWTEQARGLLPDSLLSEHLGLGFLNKDIVLSDSLANALGVEEYGPKILLQIFSSLCSSESGLKSMGLGWLSAWLSAFHVMTLNTGSESDFINNLRKLPFVPLSDGSYGSVDEGVIWLHSDALTSRVNNEYGSEAFPKLYSQLRTVSPALFLAAATADISCFDTSMTENVTRMLLRVGVQRLSAHDIMTAHILPAISDDRIKPEDEDLMTEYLAFSMFHLYSSCSECSLERERIITELRTKALILTNHGYRRPAELPIHFSKEFGNPIDINKLTDGTDMIWHEVDITCLNHPLTRSISGGVSKWRTFLLEIGVTDFVQIVQVDKNIADMPHNILKYLIRDQSLILKDSIAKDWESDELVNLLTNLSSRGDKEKCKYLLEVLDMLWDDVFSNKVTGSCNITSTGESKQFKSSLISMLNEFQWMVDDELHYPRDLFHDCVGVRSILGHIAPYALPKVRSERLLKEIGLKTEVLLDDMLSILNVWRKSETTFKASISQMSKFYNSIWSEMATSKEKVTEALLSGPFIFVPHVHGTLQEDVVPGALLSPGEVYWHDSTGSMDHMKVYLPESGEEKTHYSSSKTLSHIYPALHDFFINECGVREIPPLRSYLQVLLHLSAVALPSQAAQTVFRIFLRWTDGLKSGSLSSEDVDFLKENLMKKEFPVLPTAQDKWVSLHTFYGLVCWSDNESLRKEFKHHDNIDFIYFGELNDEEKEIYNTKFAVLMQRLGIPALSQVVTREAIYYGPADSSFRASLLNWALPYAQRYIYSVHPNEYSGLEQSGFEKLKDLQIIVVEKLYYKNIVKKAEISAKKRNECDSLLQGDILYTTQGSDSHSMFLELSRLFFGEPELHLANFLHMITTMVESGSTEEQTEFFILNSQKVPKIPDGELVWSLSSLSLARADNNIPVTNSVSSGAGEAEHLKSKSRHVNNWPPASWRMAPGLCFTRESGFKTQGANNHEIGNGDVEENMPQTDPCYPTQIKGEGALESDQRTSMPVVIVEDSKVVEIQSHYGTSEAASHVNVAFDPVDNAAAPDGLKSMPANCSEREQLSFGIPNMQQAMLTGRMGEYVAYQYFVASVGATLVRWVNEATETGLPYDLMVGDDERSREYIEVKSTKSARKDWFNISTREWQFAVEKGESFSIAHVVLSGNNMARVTLYRNPVKLCQLGKLHLAIVIPKQHESTSVS